MERIEAVRAETELLVVSLQRQVDGILAASEWSSNDDEHDPEGVTVAFERAQAQDLLNRARNELKALDAARQRVTDGTYGMCERCGRDIGEGRLEALPAVTVCIRCADRRR
ncbi:TraR/DksA family transcriptional regulator [Amycolatopsis sp. H20-H5]|uniref:TraR/DksA family transcriptional regulator n=1 Tax=Amycolatopsis sp. H20-H5 TaxID=3046309 RepID=UPI002DBD7BEB|nr:TraR/DksA C4-type zinc finger protein [Amycolatopsis sp. H20-H5]MEC3978073.1 TraR/DksA C4-type zinc finger protein [Amycolatopsis sp. H20-H5]